MTTNSDDLTSEHRRLSFGAEVKDVHGQKLLRITHNGWQWTSVELNYEEMEIVKNLLISELSKENKK